MRNHKHAIFLSDLFERNKTTYDHSPNKDDVKDIFQKYLTRNTKTLNSHISSASTSRLTLDNFERAWV